MSASKTSIRGTLLSFARPARIRGIPGRNRSPPPRAVVPSISLPSLTRWCPHNRVVVIHQGCRTLTGRLQALQAERLPQRYYRFSVSVVPSRIINSEIKMFAGLMRFTLQRQPGRCFSMSGRMVSELPQHEAVLPFYGIGPLRGAQFSRERTDFTRADVLLEGILPRYVHLSNAVHGTEKLDHLQLSRLPRDIKWMDEALFVHEEISVMNRNARRPKRANHGARPCSRASRRWKKEKLGRRSRGR